MKHCGAALFTAMALAGSGAYGETIEARVDWARRVEIGMSASGIVQQMAAEVGERIAQDSLLIQIEDTRYRHKLRMREGTVERTLIDAEETSRELERQRELYDAGSLSTVDLDHAEQAYIRARTTHERALAALELARYELGQTRMVAPFDAWVVERRLEPAETVHAVERAATAYVLAPADRYAALAQVPVTVMDRLAPGDEAVVEIGDSSYTGVLDVVRFPDVSRDTPVHYTIAIRFEAPGTRLLPGTPARIILP